MRDAMAAALRDKRFGPAVVDETTLRIDNRRLRVPDSLQGCIVNKGHERPSDIIRRAMSEKLYWEDQSDTLEAIKIIREHFNK